MTTDCIEAPVTARPATETSSVVLATPQTLATARSTKIDLYQSFWMSVIGSVAGFCVETIYCLVKYGRLESRTSLLLIPFTVVYGAGAVALYLVLRNIDKSKLPSVFVIGALTGSVVEFLFSFLEEKIFGTVSWDYSGRFLSIGGRVCFWSAIMWGALSIAWVLLIQPLFQKLIAKIPATAFKALTWRLFAFIALNAVISIAAVARWNMRLNGSSASNVVLVALDALFPDQMMSQIYPNMVFGG
ncbi:MAG: putative ABC transporter permease [Propionibacteriaceae bacterium]|nr:putative ABC transporter permease [Propionibacteriaceae bacterium]